MKNTVSNIINFKSPNIENEASAKLEALNRSQAVIEFDIQGNILGANNNFLKTVGYDLEDVIGKHHSIFLPKGEEDTKEYKDFWNNLREGQYQLAEYKRIGKTGKEIWIQATYNPVLDKKGQPAKVIKFATDITDQKLKNYEYQGQIQAINKSQAVIEFDMDGHVLQANENFLKTMGYDLEEVIGQHHKIFMISEDLKSTSYIQFWDDLRNGKFHASEYRRINKSGEEVWIRAIYNPIMDMNGRPFKVVKFATDVTDEKYRHVNHQGQIQAIYKSQAVIEFDMDGTIQSANNNFLDTMGYTLEEIEGKKHRIFLKKEDAESAEYKKFWDELRQGKYQMAEYKRLGKGEREVWIFLWKMAIR